MLPWIHTDLYEVVGEAREVCGSWGVTEQLRLVRDAAFDAPQQGGDGGHPLLLCRGAAG